MSTQTISGEERAWLETDSPGVLMRLVPIGADDLARWVGACREAVGNWDMEDVSRRITFPAIVAYWMNQTTHYDEVLPMVERADLLRCVVGNRWRHPTLDRVWHTPQVLGLMEHCADDGGLLPILADALEDAGCSDDRILLHLRDGKRHARECWALRLLSQN